MNYFFDTEFIEGFKKPLFRNKHRVLDLISIGVVSEDGRKYYAICNDFDLKYIWNNKDTWVKENVLKPLHKEMYDMMGNYHKTYHWSVYEKFTYSNVRSLLKIHGKSKQDISLDIIKFCCNDGKVPTFWAYYSSYDWVIFASIFGRMIDLPSGLPMFCMDLKQEMETNGLDKNWKKENCPDPENEHNALVDAIWNVNLYRAIQDYKRNNEKP